MRIYSCNNLNHSNKQIPYRHQAPRTYLELFISYTAISPYWIRIRKISGWEIVTAITQRCSVKKVFLKISKISKKTSKIVLDSFVNKVAGLQDWHFIEKKLQHRPFPVVFARTPILQDIWELLLLLLHHLYEENLKSKIYN